MRQTDENNNTLWHVSKFPKQYIFSSDDAMSAIKDYINHLEIENAELKSRIEEYKSMIG